MALNLSMPKYIEMEFIMKVVYLKTKSKDANKKKISRCKSRNKNSLPEKGDSRSFGTTGIDIIQRCCCKVLPWEDCEHTDKDVNDGILLFLGMENSENFT